MKNNSIIIIGAGIAGISAGCYGQMNGYNTRIFEMHTQPGGVTLARAVRRSDKKEVEDQPVLANSLERI